MNKILVICGATATGKTSLAVECAKKLNTEIISADSQLVYKGLDIGTAKPTAEEMHGVRHHMIDVAEPRQNFSVSDYERLASPIVDRLFKENKVPIVCGGTGFYINSLLYNFSYGNTPANPAIRKKYENLLSARGNSYIYNILKEVDSQTAEKLHPNDTKRIIRALEIYEAGGKRKSEIADETSPKYNYAAVAVNFPREELYTRINERVDKMFELGLVDEVKNLLDCGIDENYQCMQAIGYKEVLTGLKNNDLHRTMSDVIKQNTRHYAKRQMTFFKKLQNIVWLSPQEATAENITELLNG